MQYIAIKEELSEGKSIFCVNAIPLKNKNKSVVQKIPHPLGTDTLKFKTIDEAKDAVTRAGFSYILPDGKKELPPKRINEKTSNYEDLILNVIKDKINSPNPNVCQAAILVLAQFPSETTFDILFEKLGEENDLIRKNAILSICKYGNMLQNKIIKALEHENWITRNSALTCIKNLAENNDTDFEKYINPLIKICDDTNPIVQANAITTLAIVYQEYQKK